MFNLKVTQREAKKRLRKIHHKRCQSAIQEHWHVSDSGQVKAQSVCWLFCWAKTGQGSDDARIWAKLAFNKLFSVSFDEADLRIPHEWARENRYAPGDIESELRAFFP
jgi:hypothetical protein